MFDRLADRAERLVSSAPFFAACVVLVIIWLPSIFLMGSVDTWQLVINTVTTIVTFLLVALLQNTQARFEDAVNARLLAVLDKLGAADPVGDPGQDGDSRA